MTTQPFSYYKTFAKVSSLIVYRGLTPAGTFGEMATLAWDVWESDFYSSILSDIEVSHLLN